MLVGLWLQSSGQRSYSASFVGNPSVIRFRKKIKSPDELRAVIFREPVRRQGLQVRVRFQALENLVSLRTRVRNDGSGDPRRRHELSVHAQFIHSPLRRTGVSYRKLFRIAIEKLSHSAIFVGGGFP